MNFQTIVLVKHPLLPVWKAMRDDLSLLARHFDDMESITTTERKESSGSVAIVSVWKARPKLPDMIAKYVDRSKFVWTDYAVWDEATKTCRWHIEPRYFNDYFTNKGETRFEPAIGGSGTRITVVGNIEFKVAENAEGMRKVLEGTLFKGAMALAQRMITENFRKLGDALKIHLDTTGHAVHSPMRKGAAHGKTKG